MSEFTREFHFENLPLFGYDSPWNQPANRVAHDSERRARAVFDILREESGHRNLLEAIKAMVSDSQLFADIEQCRTKCQSNPDSDECKESQQLIVEKLSHDRLVAHQGGNLQSPGVNFDTFSYPIFETASHGEFLADLRVRAYDGTTWLSQALPPDLPLCDQPEFQSPSLSFKVPVKAKPRLKAPPAQSRLVRPSGPTGIDSDGAIVLYDPETHSEYDFWQATTQTKATKCDPLVSEGGGLPGEQILAAGGIAYFKTFKGGGRFPEIGAQFVDGLIERGSARASGLPYLGGLLMAEDLEISDGSCVEEITINHAFAFTLPRLRYVAYPKTGDPPNFVYPASSTETDNHTHNPYALAAGQRIRLKCANEVLTVDGLEYFRDTDSHSLPPITRIFLTALQVYGAYLVDGGGGFGFAAEDYRTANLNLSRSDLMQLVGITSDPDFKKVPENPTPAETWRIIMEQLNDSLSGFGRFQRQNRLTFGFGDSKSGYHMNFEVVEDLPVPPA